MKKILIATVLFILLFSVSSFAYIPGLHEKLSDIIMLNSYIENYNPYLDSNVTMEVARKIIYYSNKHGVPWAVIACMAQIESDFDNNEIGKLGEIGIMQIYTMECSGEKFNKEKLKEISYNIECGIKIFKEKMRICKGDIIMAIVRYNGKGEEAEKYVFKVALALIYMLEYRVKYFNN